MAAAALVELQVRADKLVREWCGGDCGCYSEQVPRRVIVGCLTFRICESCGGRVTYDRRRLVRSVFTS
jgi:hypothetical protein